MSFSDLTISIWSVISETDFMQTLKITPGPHLRNNKIIVVDFPYTRNTSLDFGIVVLHIICALIY